MTLSVFIELLGLLSVVTFVGSLLVVPWLIGRLPKDYFIRHRQEVAARHRRHPAMAFFIIAIRNVTGLVLFLAGIAMLMLPGQGLLTMLLGISLMDFPGKRNLIDAIICNPRVVKVLNWIRQKGKREPFIF